jgi:cysteine desulfurase
MKVYLDNAASTPLDPKVLQEMLPYLTDIQGNPSSVHFHGRQVRNAIETARKEIAALLHCSPAEIVFTSGGTEADNLAIRSTVDGLGVQHVITTKIEHHAVEHTLLNLQKQGKISIHWLDVDAVGNINLSQLEEYLQLFPNALVSLMHGNNEIGTLLDLEAVASLCSRYKAIFHSDTVQTMGLIPYNLAETHIHFITAAAHKFNGPKGVGFLYIRQGTVIPSQISGGGQERNMRAGTENVAGIIGMAAALKNGYQNLDTKLKHLKSLKSYFKMLLEQNFPGITFNGNTDLEHSLPTVLNVCFPAQAGEDLMLLFNLDIHNISASGGSACSSGSVSASHVLSGIGLPEEKALNSVRFSFGVQNTKEELDFVINKLIEILKPVSQVK